MPESAEGTLDYLPGSLLASIERVLSDAKRARRWDAPQRISFDLADPEFWAYTVYKTGNPPMRPLPGSGLEKHFAQFAKCDFTFESPTFKAQTRMTLAAVGDLMSTTPGLEAAQGRLYEHVAKEIFGADIRYANLESILSGNDCGLENKADGSPVTFATPLELDSLIRHGVTSFDVLHMANNHTMDFGDRSVTATLRVLEGLGIPALGVNNSIDDAASPRITKHGDVAIGWVAHTFGLNGKPLPEDKPWRVNVTDYNALNGPDVDVVTSQIRACHESGCDLVLVSVHWGPEWEFYPLPEQVEWAHQYAEAGADALIGHHPHVIQPVEIYRPVAFPEKSVPIIYSLGNLTPVFRHPATVLAIVAKLELSTGTLGDERRALVTGLELSPLVTLENREDGDDTGIPQLFPLASVANRELPATTREHVDAISAIADRFLGDGWRMASRE